MRARRTIRYATAATLLLLAACSAKVINVGSNHPQGPLDAAGAGGNFGDGDPCVPVREQALSTLQTSCAVCHTGSRPLSGVVGFDILDVDRLVRMCSVGLLQGWRYLVPGDPQQSLIDVRIEDGSMPKVLTDPNMLPIHVPTTSQRSVLRDWITNCLGPDPLEPGYECEVDASVGSRYVPSSATPAADN